MLCHAMPCYAMLCHAMPCYAMLCYAMLCYATVSVPRRLQCVMRTHDHAVDTIKSIRYLRLAYITHSAIEAYLVEPICWQQPSIAHCQQHLLPAMFALLAILLTTTCHASQLKLQLIPHILAHHRAAIPLYCGQVHPLLVFSISCMHRLDPKVDMNSALCAGVNACTTAG